MASKNQGDQFADWMRQAQKGDSEAYAKLLKEVNSLLKSYTRTRVSPAEKQEEVVQEILMAIHKARHTYNPDQPFFAWMFAIAHHKVVDFYRRYARVEQKEVDGEKVFETLSAPSQATEGMDDKLVAALNELTPMQRKAVDLLKIQGKSVREAASELGVSESSLKVTAHRAYKSLRRSFGVKG